MQTSQFSIKIVQTLLYADSQKKEAVTYDKLVKSDFTVGQLADIIEIDVSPYIDEDYKISSCQLKLGETILGDTKGVFNRNKTLRDWNIANGSQVNIDFTLQLALVVIEQSGQRDARPSAMQPQPQVDQVSQAMSEVANLASNAANSIAGAATDAYYHVFGQRAVANMHSDGSSVAQAMPSRFDNAVDSVKQTVTQLQQQVVQGVEKVLEKTPSANERGHQ